jgi:hypothetical protein
MSKVDIEEAVHAKVSEVQIEEKAVIPEVSKVDIEEKMSSCE